MRLGNGLMIRSSLICGFVCLGLVARAADTKDYSKEVEIIPNAVDGPKFGMAITMDVLKPRKNTNGAGVILIVSDGWARNVFLPNRLLRLRLRMLAGTIAVRC